MLLYSVTCIAKAGSNVFLLPTKDSLASQLRTIVNDAIASWQALVGFVATYLFAAIRMHAMSVSQFSRAKSNHSTTQRFAERFELT